MPYRLKLRMEMAKSRLWSHRKSSRGGCTDFVVLDILLLCWMAERGHSTTTQRLVYGEQAREQTARVSAACWVCLSLDLPNSGTSTHTWLAATSTLGLSI
jgi:hypothetical protein